MNFFESGHKQVSRDDFKIIGEGVFKLGFSPCKAKQPQQGMELQKKKVQKDESLQEICLEITYR